MGGEQQTSRRSFLKATGAFALLFSLPPNYQVLSKSPEPLSQQGYPNTPYCLLTRNWVTLQPGEHMIIHDYLDGNFMPAADYILRLISPVGDLFNGDFEVVRLGLLNARHVPSPDRQTILLTGVTPQGVEKTYRMATAGAYEKAIIMSFGPDECFPSLKKTNTTRMPYPIDPERNTLLTLSFPSDRIQEGR